MGWLDDEDQAESIFGGDDYFSHVFRSGLQSDAFDPDSEEAKSYLELAKTPPPSEAMYSDYMNKRPVLGGDDTKPSIGRKLMSAVAAMSDPHNGITLANQINRQPYENAFHNWKTEGANINNQARAADSARTREIGAAGKILSMRGQKAREDRLQTGLDARLRSKATAEELAQKREDRITRESGERQDRADRLEELRLRNESRQLDAAERAEKTSTREESKFDLEEQRKRALSARVKARKTIKEANPDWFEDPTDEKDLSINSRLTPNERERALRRIKESEDFYRRKLGLTGSPDEEY